ncbi:MAG: NYN domain-containing protein [Gemmataceae bacterium]|nr:NYN domain-containing protein [Gemmataceae bacterium]
MKASPADSEHALAVFIDFENLAMGFNGRRDRFEISRVLERLVEKGKIVVKRAYCDWSRFGQYTGPLHESAIELIEIPKRSATGKNSADIRLVVDAIDLAYSKDHIDTFCIVSGDSDFSPLVSKLKELGKHVIGLGLANATSNLLRDNCDEFIYYEDLAKPAPAVVPAVADSVPEQKRKMFALLLDSLLALRRENKEVIYSSMVKDTMKRKRPSFNEGYYGYETFSELLEDAQKQGLLEIEKSKSSGTYVVTRFGNEPKSPERKPREANGREEPRSGRSRGSRGGRGRGEGRGEVRRERAEKPRPVEADDDEAIPDVPTYRPRLAAPPGDLPPPLPVESVKAPPPLPVPVPVEKAPPPPRRAEPPRQAPKPPPARRVEGDGFGAGLDLD